MPRIPRLQLILSALFVMAVLVGYWLTRTLEPPEEQTSQRSAQPAAQNRPSTLAPNKPLTRPARGTHHVAPQDAIPRFAIANERIIRFKDESAYHKFLASLKDRGLRLLGKSDRLQAVRFGWSNPFSLGDIDGAELGYNYLVTLPVPPNAEAQAGAVGFGPNALSWLGIDNDNTLWGKGVTVAVLDSGVNDHTALNRGNGKVTHTVLTELAEGDTQLGHGTAVASIISGDHPRTPGVAPASDLLSIRITDAQGSSDSFTLAEGILLAADSGADIINISMGSYGDSALVAEAVQYAQGKGVVIVASSGNEGMEAIAYPAAYDGVIAVGAVEGNGSHLHFSNSGENLDISAPGFQVSAAWGEDQLTAFSGTSASAPFVSGAIAATMSENPHMTAQQAADLVLRVTNDAGYPGDDPAYGSGILALDRVAESGTPGIYDAAISSQFLIPADDATLLPQVLVTVQNQGTETLINSLVNIVSPSGTQEVNISSLAPGQIYTIRVPVAIPSNGDPVSVNSSVQSAEVDKDTRNNSRSDSFAQDQP
ncbi:MAG: S8 family serine peptidase [Verrucomicrobiae bacterium]|nr:S8 family serine peptidase [Verrucomicrobiae bacterium]NNJ43578.1 S8 family serine peptidase [Akkermansiaceae bacterium]